MSPLDRAPARPALAIICGELTPYRVHFHQRVAREIPELTLRTIQTYDTAWSAWRLEPPPEINVVKLSEGQFPLLKKTLGPWRAHWRQARAVVAWLNRHPPAAVLMNGYNELSRLRALRWCNRRGIPVLLWGDANIRGDTVSGLKRAVKGAFVPAFLRRCQAVLPCGSLGRAFFARYGVPDERMFLCPVEPDYHQLSHLDPARIEDARARFGLDPGRKRIVVSSRLVPHKRVDMAIDAFAALASDRPDWDLVILGDGPERAALQNRVPPHLRPRVIFTGFLGDQTTVTAVYRASHILVHPATFEPWALVINEAAAAGLAIVSSDAVGAAAELVKDGVNGRLVPAGRLDVLIRALRETTDESALPALRERSRRVLAEWRRRADPVMGLRQALRFIGALPPSSPRTEADPVAFHTGP